MEKFLESGNAVVLFSAPLRQYFIDFHSSFGVVVMHKKDKYFFCDDRYLEAAEKKAKAKVIKYTPDAVNNLLQSLSISTLGIVQTHTSASEYLALKKLNLPIKNISEEVFKLTAIKTENALKNIKKACKITENALKTSIDSLKVNITEREFSQILQCNMLSGGADGICFEPIVAFGKNSSVAHHMSGNTKLKPNMPVLVDFGCRFLGFASDMTRTFYYGAPPQHFINAYESVLKAHKKAASAVCENSLARDIDTAARESLKKDKLDKYFTHSLGHGLGLEIHEEPYLRQTSDAVIKENTVFTIEPGVYFKGKYGIRIEDTYALKSGRAKSFMSLTKNLVYIKN